MQEEEEEAGDEEVIVDFGVKLITKLEKDGRAAEEEPVRNS